MGGQGYAPAALPSRKTRYPLYRSLGGPQGRSGRIPWPSSPWRVARYPGRGKEALGKALIASDGRWLRRCQCRWSPFLAHSIYREWSGFESVGRTRQQSGGCVTGTVVSRVDCGLWVTSATLVHSSVVREWNYCAGLQCQPFKGYVKVCTSVSSECSMSTF